MALKISSECTEVDSKESALIILLIKVNGGS